MRSGAFWFALILLLALVILFVLVACVHGKPHHGHSHHHHRSGGGSGGGGGKRKGYVNGTFTTAVAAPTVAADNVPPPLHVAPADVASPIVATVEPTANPTFTNPNPNDVVLSPTSSEASTPSEPAPPAAVPAPTFVPAPVSTIADAGASAPVPVVTEPAAVAPVEGAVADGSGGKAKGYHRHHHRDEDDSEAELSESSRRHSRQAQGTISTTSQHVDFAALFAQKVQGKERDRHSSKRRKRKVC